MKMILFVSGTRADYGKLKPLIQAVEKSPDYEARIYVSGMHLSEKHGYTYHEILNDGYSHVHVAYGLNLSGKMAYDLGNLVCELDGYIRNTHPDMIVVHGDRIDALAGALAGALNNTLVAHVEGGELSGTIDDSLRHAVTKLAHLHFVSNEGAARRLVQLGEERRRIIEIGSPDIDIMMSPNLPALEEVKARYEIGFEKYGVILYHPVTTEFSRMREHSQNFVDAVLESELNYVVILPNNDLGNEIITNEYARLAYEDVRSRFKIFPSIRFEFFLSLIKNASFLLGNSSAGVRESCVYGVPSIDVGSRQNGRYSIEKIKNIQHVDESREEILEAISKVDDYRGFVSSTFGHGDSEKRFMRALDTDIWSLPLQKTFVDV